MWYRNLQGQTRLFRSAEQGGGPDAVNVVPVMVLQSALGVHIGNPQQLAIPVIAFFALKTIKAGEVNLVYETDFRDVNPTLPSLFNTGSFLNTWFFSSRQISCYKR